MKKSLPFLLILLFFGLFPHSMSSQDWIQNLPKDKIDNPEELTFFEIQKAFNDYWEPFNVKNGYYTEGGIEKKAPGWKQFKRWEWYWEYRVDPTSGKFPSLNAADIRKEVRKSTNSRNVSGNWQSMGPTTSPGGYAGLGRINCIAFAEDEPNRFYVGSPSGGFWKTEDGGATWMVTNDDMDVLGVSDAIVNAGTSGSNDTIYIATGDRDGGSMWSLSGGQVHDNNTIGVLKSIDGGGTWSSTGLVWLASDKKTVNRLLKHPADSDIIYAAATDGVFKTTDGGTTWPLLASPADEFIDMEFKPTDPLTMYGSSKSGDIYLSTDGGSSWTKKLDVVFTGIGRVELAVSADEPTWVYAVVTYSSKLYGIYKSTDSGTTYTKIFDGTVAGNFLLGYYCLGTTDGGQGGYDLCIAADPSDATTVFLGGVNTWKSTDGGVSWTISNMWTPSSTFNSCGAAVAHADKHALVYQPGTNDLFEGNDGGVYKTSDGGVTWPYLGSGLVTSQLYRLGVSQTSSSSVIIGLQDNGTKSRLAGTWTDVIGGDGMECIIDYTDVDVQYGEYIEGDISRTTDGWATSTSISGSFTGYAYWVTPYVIDPTTHTTLYAGLDEIWKSTDQGTSWTTISSFGTAPTTYRSLAVAPSSSLTIYAATRSKIDITIDGGTSWTDVTGTLPVGSSYITYVSVKDDDDQTVWVSMGAYNAYGVFESTDGGTTWTDISTGLPTIPVMCVIQNKQNTTEVELYAGTDVGVYVKIGSADWTLYSNNLPNVVVNELEIYYNTASPNLSRLRAATSGRGLWQSELYSVAGLAPTSDFEASSTAPMVNQAVSFTDLTIDDPASWFWSFDPATVEYVEGTSSTSQNPVVKFTDAGTYEVSLYTENANGNDTETKTAYITVTVGSPTYCEAYSTGTYGYISRVEFGTIDKTSTFTDIGGGKYYQDWTALSTDVTLLNSYSLIVTNPYSDVDIDLGVWIDWNQDGDFEDNLENVVCEIGNSGEGTFSIDIPSIAVLGTTRMRLRTSYWSTNCDNSCGSTLNGEVEDYSVNVVAGDITWEGNTSVDWATTSNWNPTLVPTASFNVTVPTTPVGSLFPEISLGTDAICKDLTIETGADVKLYGNLSINGTFTNNAGTSGLVVKSDASGTGSLISQTNNIDVTVERYFEGGKWHLFGAPVANQDANAVYFNHSPDVWLKTYVESTDTWSPTITDLSTLLPMGKGFAIWIETGNNATASFEDQLKSVDYLISGLAFTDVSHGYNLVANPFTSAIDWDQGSWARTNLDGSVWVYDPVGGSYKDRNSVGIGSLTGGIIPSSQGFFVRATTSGGSISVPANARVHNSQAFYKNTNQNADENPGYTLAALEVSKGEKTDEVWFAFNEACSDTYDTGWDVSKFFGDYDAPQLYAMEADQLLSIDALPVLEQERIVSLNFKAGAEGDHLLILKEFENFEETEIWLEDLETETLQELTTNPEYSFYATTYLSTERFLLHFNPQVTGIIQNSENNYSIYSWKKSVYIKNPELTSNTTVDIVDMFGRIIYQGKLQAISLNKIDLHLSNSYMVVRLTDYGSVTVQKVFIR